VVPWSNCHKYCRRSSFFFCFPSVQIMSQEPANNIWGTTVATVYEYMGKSMFHETFL
jgi:hypothetical protein